MIPPVVVVHEGVHVVRDDLFAGGTKARFLPALFEGIDEIVYASPVQGGAQSAIAHVAAALGKRATIFVAQRAVPHPRSLMAKRLGAKVLQVRPGYLTVVQKRARAYAAATPGSLLAPFGIDLPEGPQAIATAARMTGLQPVEVWCAGGSGVLARGLAMAWPDVPLHVVQIGRPVERLPRGTILHVHPLEFGAHCTIKPPFPSDPHYDAKAWQLCTRLRRKDGTVLFWNVTGHAEP